MRRPALLLFLVLGACSDPPVTPPDAGGDTGTADTGTPFVPTVPAVARPPVLTPCPEGWREVEGPDFVECDPWPATGRADCGPGEAHFAGEPECRRIGSACPADGVPGSLPADAIHVRQGATGGDGSAGAPFATIAEALEVAGRDVTIALAVGTYAESSVLSDQNVTIVGACSDSVVAPGGVEVAFYLFGGSLTLRNLRIRDGTNGILTRGGTVTVESVVFEDLTDTAAATSMESQFDASDVLVRRARNGGFFFADTTVSLDAIVVENAEGFPIAASRSTVMAVDVVAEDIRESSTAGFVQAVASDVTVERSVFSSDPLAASFAVESSLRIADTALIAPEGAGSAVEQIVFIGSGASSIDLERVTITRGGGLVVGVAGEESSIRARDVVIREMVDEGHAIEIGAGAAASLERVFVERAGRVGLLLFDPGTTASVTDLRVRASQPDPSGFWGRGINVQTGATMTAERVLLEEHHEASLVVASEDTSATFLDLVIRNTRERGCTATGCPSAGIGLGAYESGTVRVERFEISDNALAGVQIANRGVIELVDGVVSGSPVGANIQVADYDVGLLTDRVDYRDNGANLDSSELFVPEPSVDVVEP